VNLQWAGANCRTGAPKAHVFSEQNNVEKTGELSLERARIEFVDDSRGCCMRPMNIALDRFF